ncbi:hypothetical protein FOZ63_031179, partial [Perkinsus olseni]
YKTVRNGTDKVCSTLPLLTDFEVTVREDGGQQVAVVNAKVADEVFQMTRDVRLVWYGETFTRSRKRKSSSEIAVAAKKRSTSRKEPSEEMARSPASDISDFVPDWLLDEELGLDTGWASAPDVGTLWGENSQPKEPVHAHRSPELSLGITEDTIEDEENLNVQAGPPPTHGVAGDGSPAPSSLFPVEFPEDVLDNWLLFPELFSPVNLEPTEDVQ